MSKKDIFFVVIPDDGGSAISFLRQVDNIVQEKQCGDNVAQVKKGIERGCVKNDGGVCVSRIPKSPRLLRPIRTRRY